MRITRDKVKLFEDTQEQHGTKVAIENVLWLLASEILTDIGVKHLKTSYKENKINK